MAETDLLAAAELRLVSAHRVVERVVLRQPQLGPDLQGSPGHAVAPAHIVPVGAAAVEQVELDQLDALVLEIEERAVDAPAVRAEVGGPRSGRAAARVPRRPVALPVEPGHAAPRHRPIAAAAARGVFLDLSQEAHGALLGHRAEPALRDGEAGIDGLSLGGAAPDGQGGERGHEGGGGRSGQAHGEPPSSDRSGGDDSALGWWCHSL